MLTVAYISNGDSGKVARERKATAKEIFHRKALEGLAARLVQDEKRANKLFAPEQAELDELKLRLRTLREVANN